MDTKTLSTLAQRVQAKFRGRYPGGVTAQDCYQDACCLLLELEEQADSRVPAGVDRQAWLVTRAHGDLRDRYARMWKRQNQINVVQSVEGYEGQANPTVSDGDPSTAVDVRDAVARLEGVERDVMEQALEGKTQDQIAAAIGHTQPSVSQIMNRARKKLSIILAAYEDR